MKTDGKGVVIVGGGPAGSIAALCLRKLGRDVVIFEKEHFPRYRIGESLLPGTLSILQRLGISEKIEAASFIKKRAATFIWGESLPPWSFTFAAPKTAPWVFDHAYQVNRAEYDRILLEAAAERGATVKHRYEVTDLDLGSSNGSTNVSWKNDTTKGTVGGGFVVDASGSRGVVARKLNLRIWDKYYRNMAVWSYFKGGKRYQGDLEGNTFSVAFKEGWIWIIPLKNDTYSIGVVTGIESNERIREVGAHNFYYECIEMCPVAKDILSTAKQSDEMHVVRDWSYEAKKLSLGRAFLCGDAACFIDPLFSQGVHLATYSATLAAAAIDYLYENPQQAESVHAWYDQAYREAYHRYHRFIAAFYACSQYPDSKFWNSRKIEGARDHRFEGKDWFATLTGGTSEEADDSVEELHEGAATLARLWQHSSQTLSDKYDSKELSLRRVQWASQLLRQFQSMETIYWKGREARLYPSFQVHPTSFKLESKLFIGDENGKTMKAYSLGEQHRRLFETLKTQPLSYRVLTRKLKEIGAEGPPLHVVGRLFEENLLQGFDKEKKPVQVQYALRFGGVGSDDDIS